MALDPSILASLAQLSAPGFNRAIGMGDVVPYLGQQQNQSGASGAGQATPGVSYDPNPMGGMTSPTMDGGSILNNLSALTPILNQIIQQQMSGAIPSGQGNMMANPLSGAVPGVSSQGFATQIGGQPIAGSGGKVPGLAPAGTSAPSGDAGSDGGGAGAAASGPAGVGGTSGGEGAAAAGVAGATGAGASAGGGDAGAPGAGGVGDAGAGAAAAGAPGGVGDASGAAAAGDAAGAAAAGAVGDSGDGGGGAGGGGGSTVICTELRRQGLMDDITWAADRAFGLAQTQATRNGYYLWAAPVARGMARSKVFTYIVASLALPWAREMAYQMGARRKGSIAGRIIMAIGRPLCTYLGGRIGVKTGGVRA